MPPSQDTCDVIFPLLMPPTHTVRSSHPLKVACRPCWHQLPSPRVHLFSTSLLLSLSFSFWFSRLLSITKHVLLSAPVKRNGSDVEAEVHGENILLHIEASHLLAKWRTSCRRELPLSASSLPAFPTLLSFDNCLLPCKVLAIFYYSVEYFNILNCFVVYSKKLSI